MNLSRTLGQLETSAQLTAVFSQEDLVDLPLLFDFYDTERTGSVNGRTVMHMLFKLGFMVEPDSINPNRLHTLEDFMNMAGRCHTRDQQRQVDMKQARKIFQMVDPASHGTVDPDQMFRFLASAGVRGITLEQATNLVSAIDRTDDDADCFGMEDLHHFMEKFAKSLEERLAAAKSKPAKLRTAEDKFLAELEAEEEAERLAAKSAPPPAADAGSGGDDEPGSGGEATEGGDEVGAGAGAGVGAGSAEEAAPAPAAEPATPVRKKRGKGKPRSRAASRRGRRFSDSDSDERDAEEEEPAPLGDDSSSSDEE